MKSKLFLSLLAAGCLLFNVAVAGTLENADTDGYRFEMIGFDGRPLANSTIYGQSILYGVCDAGCQVKLLNTGQTITMNPGDDIVIEDGVMRRKED